MRSRRSGRAREERLARTKGEFESRGVLKRLRLDGFGRLFRRLPRGLFGFPFVEKGEKRTCSDLQTMDSSNLTREWVNTTPHLACLLLIGDRKRRESICFAFFDRRADLFIGCFWIGGARLWVAAVVLLSWRPKLGWERGRREGRLGGRRRKMEASFVFFLARRRRRRFFFKGQSFPELTFSDSSTLSAHQFRPHQTVRQGRR